LILNGRREDESADTAARRMDKMKRLMLAVLVTAFAVGSAAAQGACESRAVGQDGRPLAGAAKNSFLAKCKREACAPKAVGSDGKPLRGAAKNSFMTKCQREA
jgi:hypothetical protein